jgi:predicted amidohydrolase
LDGWKEKLFQRYLIWNCRPAKIRRYLQNRLPALPLPNPVDRRQIRVAALQVKLELCQNPFLFADLVHRRVKEANQAGARLVVFPEYLNLLLFGVLPGINRLEQEVSAEPATIRDDAVQVETEEISLPDLFRYMTPAVLPLMVTLFSALAVAYRLYIMAGSYTLAVNGAVANRAFLFGPDGNLLGTQDKVHLLPVEEEWKLKRGQEIKVFDTALGGMAMPVCMDATYFETFRIMENRGAEIAMLPIANLEAYNYWLALRGIWPRVQESPLFGIKSALVGSIAGLTFTGRAGIFAPLELTVNGDGVLAEVEHFDREAMAVADLDLEALRELRRNHPWRDRNPVLYSRYFPEIYRR